MTDEAPDRIVFVMTDGTSRFYRTTARGDAEQFFRSMIERNPHWIEVDDLQWIQRDHVHYVYLARSDDISVL